MLDHNTVFSLGKHFEYKHRMKAVVEVLEIFPYCQIFDTSVLVNYQISNC